MIPIPENNSVMIYSSIILFSLCVFILLPILPLHNNKNRYDIIGSDSVYSNIIFILFFMVFVFPFCFFRRRGLCVVKLGVNSNMNMKENIIPYVEMRWNGEDRDWTLQDNCEYTTVDLDMWDELKRELNNYYHDGVGIAVDTLDIKIPTRRTIDGYNWCMNEFIDYRHWGKEPSWFSGLRYITRIYFYRQCERGIITVDSDRESNHSENVRLFYEDILALLDRMGGEDVRVQENIAIKFRGNHENMVDRDWIMRNLILEHRDILNKILEWTDSHSLETRYKHERCNVSVVVSGRDDAWDSYIDLDHDILG